MYNFNTHFLTAMNYACELGKAIVENTIAEGHDAHLCEATVAGDGHVHIEVDIVFKGDEYVTSGSISIDFEDYNEWLAEGMNNAVNEGYEAWFMSDIGKADENMKKYW